MIERRRTTWTSPATLPENLLSLEKNSFVLKYNRGNRNDTFRGIMFGLCFDKVASSICICSVIDI